VKRLFTVAAGDPGTLGAALAARLGLGPADAAALIRRGEVRLDGRRAGDPAAAVRPGQRVVAHLQPAPPPAPLDIVHQDEALLVVDKPAGVPSQATPGEAAGALDALVQARFPSARLLHRLDRDASGLVLFSLDPSARRALQAALEAGAIERRYLALCAGRLDGDGEIRLRIARDGRDARRRQALPENAPGGEAARTRWRALRSDGERTLLEVELDTGRTHQIRVHLQARGHPLVGDTLYGGPPAPRLALHAHRLDLPHPVTGAPLQLIVRPPTILEP
jgi:RluA family pseudouridine synthase